MSIGNFKSKGPAAPASKGPVSPTKNVANALESTLSKDLEETEDTIARVKSYEEILKDAKISAEEADTIRDAVLLTDVYSEVIQLSDRVSCTFRTRSYSDHVRYNRALERHQPQYISEERDLMLRYYLAASLECFRGTAFKFPSTKDHDAAEEAFEERHQFVMGLSEAVVSLLAQKLDKFDNKVRIVLSKGAVEDF